MTTRVVGLTGGIASGKSTVGREFKELGVPVIDADLLAREVVEPGTEGLAEVVRVFGPEILNPDGTLNRKALGAVVFDDPAARAQLNAITHPRIAQLGAQRIREHSRQGKPYLLYEAALIVENGLHRGMHALVVVATDALTQLQRLMQRDQLSEAAAQARLSAQMPLGEKLEVADYIIQNDGGTDDLAHRVRAVHEQLLAEREGRS